MTFNGIIGFGEYFIRFTTTPKITNIKTTSTLSLCQKLGSLKLHYTPGTDKTSSTSSFKLCKEQILFSTAPWPRNRFPSPTTYEAQ